MVSCIQNRCSTRKFCAEMLKDEELREILAAARTAPSGKNDRTAKLYVFKDARMLEELNVLLKSCIASGGADGIPKAQGAFALQEGYHFSYHSPVFVLTTDAKNGYNSYANGGTLIENAMLQAAELNIGSCWINTVRRCEKDPALQCFLRRFGFDPERECVTGGIALGYPAEPLQGKRQTKGNEIIYI